MPLFDFDPPPPPAVADAPRRATSKALPPRTMPCPFLVAGERCGRPVEGVDPRRCCARCQSEHGAPDALSYEAAGFSFEEHVIVLGNARLIDEPKAEVGSFSPEVA